MKKIRMMIGIMVTSVFFVSASIWEGAAVVALENELPRNGYFAATNSFPPNTVVYMTNLESGKTIQAVISAPLDSPILLAMVSREAAYAMGIQDQSVTRIRMIQLGESGISSLVTENIYAEGGTLTKVQDDPTIVPPPEEFAAGTYPWHENLPDAVANAPPSEEIKPEGLSLEGSAEPPETLSRPQLPDTPGGYDLSLIPAEERPPVEITNAWQLPPEAEIAAVTSSVTAPPAGAKIDPALIIPSWEERETAVSPNQPSPDLHGEGLFFSVPVISSLENGKYYLQLRAFGRRELVEAELSKIGKNYPLVIQQAEGSNGSVYRILLGPVSLGESGALLQRFKGAGYEDAFIRRGMY